MDLPLNQIIHGDCLEIMRKIPDKSVDLILTDPPYGLGYENHNRAGTQRGKSKAVCRDYGFFEWDNFRLTKEYFDEIFRISKDQIIFGGNYYISFLYDSPCWLVWDKNNGNNGYADCEIAWTSFKTAIRKFKWTWHGFIQEDMKNKEQRYHPTQKPVALMEWILRNYSKKGDIVLDPFIGSGTTAIAALNTGRFFIGIEKEEKYVEIARKRIAEHMQQQSIV